MDPRNDLQTKGGFIYSVYQSPSPVAVFRRLIARQALAHEELSFPRLDPLLYVHPARDEDRAAADYEHRPCAGA